MARSTTLFLLGMGLLFTAGCGDGKLRCYPATGKVLLNGKPYEGARVIFCPVGGGEKLQKERPYGVTDQNGEFELTTFLKGDGAPVGDYNIMIRTGRPRGREQAQRFSRQPRIARRFGKPEESGVSATIEAAENELAPFEVEADERRR